MSEEEIIKRLKNIIEINKSFLNYDIQNGSNIYKDIQGLLDLYKKEKEKNEELEKYRGLYENEMLGYIAGYEDGKRHKLTATIIVAEENKQKRLEQIIKQKYISKDKIRKKIEKLNNEMLNENNSLELFYRKKYCKEVLQELLEESESNDI